MFPEPSHTEYYHQCMSGVYIRSLRPTFIRSHKFVILPLGVTSQGAGGGAAAPPIAGSGKPIIFRAKAKFFGQKPAANNGNFVCIY